MKKLPAIAAGLLLIGVAGWSALWYAGRDSVAARIDGEIVALRAQGYGITHGTREIGGFPYGYRVTYRDVTVRMPGFGPAAGATYVLPEITAEVTAADVERVVAYFPEKFRLEIPVPPDQRAQAADRPERLTIDIEAAGLTAAVDGLAGTGREVAVAAQSVLAVSAGPNQGANLAIEFKGLDAAFAVPPATSAGPSTSRTVIDRVEYAYAVTTRDGRPGALEGSVDAVRLTGKSDIRDAAGWLAVLGGAPGSASAAYQTGASAGAFRVTDGPGGVAATLAFSAASTAGTVAVADGAVRLDASGQANRVALSLPPKDGAAAGASYAAELRAIEVGYALPIAPREAMSPVILRLALDQVTPDDALWALLDAKGTLPRDPARLVIDIEGSARLTAPLSEQRPGAAPPVEIGSLTVRAADLKVLGAAVRTRGDVEFLQPIWQPIGRLTVTLTNAFELVNRLAEAGLFDRATAQTAILMATGFTAPGAVQGERVAEIELTLEGIKVNGVMVGR